MANWSKHIYFSLFCWREQVLVCGTGRSQLVAWTTGSSTALGTLHGCTMVVSISRRSLGMGSRPGKGKLWHSLFTGNSVNSKKNGILSTGENNWVCISLLWLCYDCVSWKNSRAWKAWWSRWAGGIDSSLASACVRRSCSRKLYFLWGLYSKSSM